jgi:hypothetical protein
MSEWLGAVASRSAICCLNVFRAVRCDVFVSCLCWIFDWVPCCGAEVGPALGLGLGARGFAII